MDLAMLDLSEADWQMAEGIASCVCTYMRASTK